MSESKSLSPWIDNVINSLDSYTDKINPTLEELKLNKLNLSKYVISLKQQAKSANNKFTMAFVGEFKTGKSTIINSILNLYGDAALSNCDSPDTAKCIRIMKKNNDMDYDAEIIYESDTYENEKLSWVDAKKLTSQVALDADPSLKAKADKIDEVRYYINNDFLDICNILDLPGTGAGGHSEDHTAVTFRKIEETEVVFWIVSTVEEPGKEAIANLERFKNKIVPVINVWQDKSQDIEGDFTAEDIKKILEERYSSYFSDVQKPIAYYAKEIYNAQQRDEEIKDEWGKAEFFDCLSSLLSADVVDLEKDKVTRIKKQITTIIDKIYKELVEVNDKIEDVVLNNEKENNDIFLLETSLSTIQRGADIELKNQAKSTADEIVSYISKMTEVFIEDQMDSVNISTVVRQIGRKNREKLLKEMEAEYLNKYLKIDEEPCWYFSMLQSFRDDVSILLNGAYAKFGIEAKKSGNNNALKIDKDFTDTIIKQTLKSFCEDLIPIIKTIIMAVVLYLIPGGLIIDNISVALMGGNAFKSNDKLSKRKENIKNRTRLSIGMQKYDIQNRLLNEARYINKRCKEEIQIAITDRKDVVKNIDEKIIDIKTDLENFISSLDLYSEQVCNF